MASIHFEITWELNHLHRKTFIQFLICLLHGRSLSLRIEVRFLVVSLLVLLVEKSVVCDNLLPGNVDLPTHPTQRKKGREGGREGGREEGRKAGRKEGRKEGIASAITIVTARGAYFILEAGEAAFWAQVFIGLKALMSF